jgi:mono/diheme cytochrome c family protein
MKKTLVIALFLSLTALSAQSAVIKPATPELPKPTQKAIVAPAIQPTNSDSSSQQTSSGSSSASIDPKTQRTWNAKCASCHGEDGKGQTVRGVSMAISDFSTAAWQKSFTNDMIKQAIEYGVKRDKNGVHQQMDAFALKLKPEQIDDLVLMVCSFGK